MYCSLYAVFLGCHTHMPPSIYGVEGTYSHLTNELYAIASHSNYDRSRDHWCRAWRCLRVNKGLLIGLRAFKRAQLSLRLTVRTLTRPCIAQLSRNRRAVENERRRADWDSVLSSLGDVLRGLPERSRFLTVLASLWRCADSIQYFACQWLPISVQVLTYVWASSKCEYEWYTPITTAWETRYV
jgi:hypothetical protein